MFRAFSFFEKEREKKKRGRERDSLRERGLSIFHVFVRSFLSPFFLFFNVFFASFYIFMGFFSDRLSKPVILDPHPYNISVMYGEMASFQCNVHSAITPNIQVRKIQTDW